MFTSKNSVRLTGMGKILAAGILSLVVASCASKSPELQQTSGFLSDYTLLKPVSSPKGTQIYTYKNPSISRNDYHAVVVKPVRLYQTATEDGVTAQQIETARANIDKGIKEIVSRKIPITSTPAKGVATLDVAITGATVEGKGFSPLNLIPISAALKLASMATDLDSKKPILVVELKFTDSLSGELLRETVTMISGESFRNRANTAKEFEQLAKNWVQQALKYSAAQG